jgi:protein SCO1/2
MSKRAALLLLVACLAGGLGLWASQRFHAPASPALPAVKAVTLLPDPRVLPAFSLQQSDGSPLTVDDLKGHWTMVFLGFTHCPDICPTTLAQLAGAQKQWAALPGRHPPARAVRFHRPRARQPQAHRRLRACLPCGHAGGHRADPATGGIRALAVAGVHEGARPQRQAGRLQHRPLPPSSVLDPQVRMAGVAQPPFDIRAIAADLERLTKATP